MTLGEFTENLQQYDPGLTISIQIGTNEDCIMCWEPHPDKEGIFQFRVLPMPKRKKS